MKIYAVMLTEGDGCTYAFEVPLKFFKNKEDAETECTRLQLLWLRNKDERYPFDNLKKILSKEDFDLLEQFGSCLEYPFVQEYELH